MANSFNIGEGSTVPTKGPVELKVKVAAFATYVGVTALLYILIALSSDSTLLSPLPDIIEPLIIGLIPTAITYFSAYQARHTARNDTDALAR